MVGDGKEWQRVIGVLDDAGCWWWVAEGGRGCWLMAESGRGCWLMLVDAG